MPFDLAIDRAGFSANSSVRSWQIAHPASLTRKVTRVRTTTRVLKRSLGSFALLGQRQTREGQYRRTFWYQGGSVEGLLYDRSVGVRIQ